MASGTFSKQTELIMKERAQVSFNVEEMTNILDGGPEETANRREMVRRIQSDPVLGDMDFCYQTPAQRRPQAIRRALRLGRMDIDFNGKNQPHLFKATAKEVALPIHGGAFIPTITNLGTSEQVEKWVTLANNFHIIGTYAQTELGHGTNLRGLETTATYDPKTQEFVINSPELTSMKWWPGDLGKFANHAVVMANLIINNKSYGMNPFIVQIRDLDTHMPLPGVKVGDIGERIAFEINDNGFLMFDHVRIPRENMLAGLAEVLPDGTYQKKGDERVMYSCMLLLRVRLVDSQAIFPLQVASTIATRYSIIRTQGAFKRGDPEIPVMDYVTQQHKILPNIAAAYVYEFSSKRTSSLYQEIVAEVKAGNYNNLPELHALTAGMKAYLTEKCFVGAETCRRACGGHGYLKASGFSNLILGQMASVTYEGENTVMFLQCARYLLKCAADSMMGGKVSGIASYLNEPLPARCSANTAAELGKPEVLLECFKHRASLLIREAAMKMQSMVQSGSPQTEAWNKTSVDLVAMAKAHLDYYVLSTFIDTLRNVQASYKTKSVLTALCSLFGLHVINENTGDLLKSGFLSASQVSLAREAEIELLGRLRPDAVGLVDAFDNTDKTLQTCIGTYDGNAYERLYENAKKSPRNQSEIDEDYYEVMRPYLHKGRDILKGGYKSKL